jgi:hypothetical protein
VTQRFRFCFRPGRFSWLPSDNHFQSISIKVPFQRDFPIVQVSSGYSKVGTVEKYIMEASAWDLHFPRLMQTTANSSKGRSTTMAIPRLNLLTATIKDLQASLTKGEVTSVQLVTDYLVSLTFSRRSGFELIRFPSHCRNVSSGIISMGCSCVR